MEPIQKDAALRHDLKLWIYRLISRTKNIVMNKQIFFEKSSGPGILETEPSTG
jgi:hypothetical protein